MNRTFLLIIWGYLVVTVAVALVTDGNINGITDRQFIRVAIYTPIVFSSWLLAISAVMSAVSKRRRGVMQWLAWPPEWDSTVAFWALTKSTFFSALWCYGMDWHPPEYVLELTLVLFGIAHVMFTAQWLGDGRSPRPGPEA